MGATPADGPLRESGETWECDGLFVADASVLPTALGINPMITIEAVSYVIAEQVSVFLVWIITSMRVFLSRKQLAHD